LPRIVGRGELHDPDRELDRRPRRDITTCCRTPTCTSSAEHFLPIHFHFMAVKGASLAPSRPWRATSTIGQCRPLHPRAPLPRGRRRDTGGAAMHVARARDETRAALAPKLAAYILLTILAEK